MYSATHTIIDTSCLMWWSAPSLVHIIHAFDPLMWALCSCAIALTLGGLSAIIAVACKTGPSALRYVENAIQQCLRMVAMPIEACYAHVYSLCTYALIRTVNMLNDGASCIKTAATAGCSYTGRTVTQACQPPIRSLTRWTQAFAATTCTTYTTISSLLSIAARPMAHMARETLTQYDHWVQGNPWATNVACWYATLTWSSTAYLANAGAHLAVSTLHYTLSMADRAISHCTPPPTALPHTEDALYPRIVHSWAFAVTWRALTMTMTIFAARSHHPRSQKSQPIPTQETPLPGTTSFQLLLTLLSGTTKVIDVNPTHTIRALKWKIKDVIGIYPTKFRITIDGRPLATDAEELQSIKDHGITAEATVRIQLYILGGGKKGAKPLKHHVIYHGKVNGKKDGEDLYGVYPDTDWMRDIKVTQDGVPSSRAVGYDTLEEAEAEWRNALLANPTTNPIHCTPTSSILPTRCVMNSSLPLKQKSVARDGLR